MTLEEAIRRASYWRGIDAASRAASQAAVDLSNSGGTNEEVFTLHKFSLTLLEAYERWVDSDDGKIVLETLKESEKHLHSIH